MVVPINWVHFVLRRRTGLVTFPKLSLFEIHKTESGSYQKPTKIDACYQIFRLWSKRACLHKFNICLNSTSSGSDKVDDAVSAAATAEAEGDEHQDAGDANWGEILV